jgi:hypothetical protein
VKEQDASLFDAVGMQLLHKPKRRRSGGILSSINVSRELEIGRAAEYLVCADLLLNGWTAYTTDQGLPYDVVVDACSTLVRVQVKSTLCPRYAGPFTKTPAYLFEIRHRCKEGRRAYQENELDICAFVALDRRAVAYFAFEELPTHIGLRIPGACYSNGARNFREFAGATFGRALEQWQELTGKVAARAGTPEDVVVQRWQQVTGGSAKHNNAGQSFDELAAMKRQPA